MTPTNNLSREHRPLLAVLIDADNVPAKQAAAILREIADIGDPALRRVYGDWSSPALAPWQEQIRALGMVARQQSANTKGKNASDIGLVIDAMDILHAQRFDGFVLVSSDSDFTQLASRLREDGKLVIGIGEKKTPASLRNVCNRFIFIENLETEDTPKNANSQPTKAQRKEPPSKAVPLFRKAMGKMDQQDEWYNLSSLHNHIRAAHPDFDPRTYGYTKLSELAANLPGFKIRKSGNSVELCWKPNKG